MKEKPGLKGDVDKKNGKVYKKKIKGGCRKLNKRK